MLKLVVYTPESHAEAIKQAMFDAGAGRIGQYEHCCWQSLGQGQFRPLAGSEPYIGNTPQTGEQAALETVLEIKIELVCDDAIMSAVVAAMKTAHPYEEPAYQVLQILDY